MQSSVKIPQLLAFISEEAQMQGQERQHVRDPVSPERNTMLARRVQFTPGKTHLAPSSFEFLKQKFSSRNAAKQSEGSDCPPPRCEPPQDLTRAQSSHLVSAFLAGAQSSEADMSAAPAG